MSRSVLCAVDISQPKVETDVLKKAAQLAEMEGARLDVITVVPDFGMSMVGGFFDAGHVEKAVDAAKGALNELCEGVFGAEANAKVSHLVANGSAYEEILKAAAAVGSSLIVIGAHKPDFKDYLLGPNAARVVRHSNCSVFVVR